MNTALEIIKNSNILTDTDLNSLNDIKEDIQSAFLYSQVFRTRTEMEFSVLNDVDFPTPDAKFWQSQREQNCHFHELAMLSYEYRKNNVEIEQLKRKLEKEEDDLEKELLVIEIQKKEFIALNHERVAKDRIREVKAWADIKSRLKPQMQFSDTDVNEHQLDSYSKSFALKMQALQPTDDLASRINMSSQFMTLSTRGNEIKEINSTNLLRLEG